MIQLFAFLPFPKPKEKEGPFVGRRGSGGCVRALVRACVRAIHMITCVQLPALACWLGIPAMPPPAPPPTPPRSPRPHHSSSSMALS